MTEVLILVEKNDATIMTPRLVFKLSDVACFCLNKYALRSIHDEILHIRESSMYMRDHTIIDETTQCMKEIISQLKTSNLVYIVCNDVIIIPKTSVKFVRALVTERSRQTELLSFGNIYGICLKVDSMKNGTFEIKGTHQDMIMIQEDILLSKSIEDSKKNSDIEIMKRDNEMMRAHIQFSPGGELFLQTFTGFKDKATAQEAPKQDLVDK